MAGLFRQAAAEAARYRASGRHSTGRLLWLATVLLLIIAGLVGFGIYRGGVTSQADQEAMRAAIDSQVRWYQELRDQAGALDSYTEFQPEEGGRVPWTSWNKKVEELFAAAGTPRFALEEKLPGADRATYQAIAEAVPIREARIDWTDAASRLQRRRDLVAALGLIGPSSDRPAVLQIPPPPDFTVAQAQLAWDSFQKHYPNSADWSLDGLPAGVAREISAAAQTSNQHLLLAGRNEILWKLDRLTPDGKETPALWRELRAWLRMPTELTAWRRLTLFALRLTDPAADDPIDALATFLDRNQHEIELQRLVLRVPAGAKLTPDGKLTIYHGRSDDVENKLAFVPLGEPRRDDDGTTRYTFVPEAGESLTLRIRYRPGDTLWAELPVQMADRQPRLLTWSLCRSQVFQFERLVRPPRLHRKDQQATEGELLPDVALIVAVGLVPRLPELIPVVKLSRR